MAVQAAKIKFWSKNEQKRSENVLCGIFLLQNKQNTAFRKLDSFDRLWGSRVATVLEKNLKNEKRQIEWAQSSGTTSTYSADAEEIGRNRKSEKCH